MNNSPLAASVSRRFPRVSISRQWMSIVTRGLASSRRSVSQGAAQKTAPFFYFSRAVFCAAPWLTERMEEATRGTKMAQWWERPPPITVAWVRFRPGTICRLSLLFSPCFESFSPGSPSSPVLPPPQNPDAPNSNSTRIEDLHENEQFPIKIPARSKNCWKTIVQGRP